MLAPVKPANPGHHPLSRELGMSYWIGREYVQDGLRSVCRDGWAAVDIETYGLGLLGRDIKVITLANTSEAVLVDIRDPIQRELLDDHLANLDRLIMHNSPYDATNLGINQMIGPDDAFKITDTLIYARLAEPSMIIPKSLEDCGQRYLKINKSGTTMNRIFRELGLTIKEGWKQFDLDRPVYIYGAAMDALITARLEPEVRKAAFTRITKGHPWVKGEYGVHGPGAERLVEREQVINRRMLWRSIKGLRIDLEWADVYENSHRRELHTAHLIMDRAGVTLNKPASLIKVLELEGAIPEIFPRTKKTKAWSTSKDHLKLLHHPAAEAYVTAKEIEHVQNDYLGKCLELEHDGRIHPQVNILAAVTGRASMGDPPLHQFPGDARGIVLADPGDQMTSIDWSQIEPVLAANMAKDHDVLVGYESGAMDFYESIAATAMIPRKHAKVVLLAQLYGEGIKALALDLGITVEEAKELREVVYRPIPKVRKLVSNMMGIAERYKRVFTLSGRIIPIGVGKDGQVYAHTGINYLVQGSAYDTLAEALIRIEEAGLGESVYLTMHDELIVSTSASRDVRKIMTEPPERLIQLARRTPVLRTDLLDLGDRWAEA